MESLVNFDVQHTSTLRAEVVSIQTLSPQWPNTAWSPSDPSESDSHKTEILPDYVPDGAESKDTLVAAPSANLFDPTKLTTLDLSGLQEGAQYIFETGSLPQWICNFRNLQTLNASKTGLIILQPWLVNLEELRSLHLEHNLISTWPWFLRDSRKLRSINLDGNPCLERAFCKSPSLRSWFFSWNASNDVCKSVPKYIRGQEWPPASSARLSSSDLMNGLGFFCGGIYLLTTKEDSSNDGLLTPLEPDPLFTRLYTCSESATKRNIDEDELGPSCSSAKSICSSSSGHSNRTNISSLNLEVNLNKAIAKNFNVKQTQILTEIFDDIFTLRERHKAIRPSTEKPHVLLIGGPTDRVNRLLYSKQNKNLRFTAQESYNYASLMVREEEAYILELEFVCRHFYQARLKSSEICDQLRVVFTGYPAMLSIHKKHILPSLKAFQKAMLKLVQPEGSRLMNPETSDLRRSSLDTALQMAANLATAFRRLQLALESYSKNLWRAEHLLDVPSAATSLYSSEDFGDYVSSRLTKLNGLGGHGGANFSVSSPNFLSAESLNFSNFSLSKDSANSSHSSSEPKLKVMSGLQHNRLRWTKPKSLNQWVNDELCKRNPSILRNPADFIYMPLARLTRYERFFTSFSRVNQRYDTLVRVFRGMRRLVASEIQSARRRARCEVLATKLKTTPQYFEQYKWDAVVTVRSRGYFEHGILSKSTMDVLDFGDRPVSFVKEVFSPSKLRILRLVYCGNDIILWDEIFEHFIGRIKKSMLIAMPAKSLSHPSELRIIFLDARETCLVEVKDFRAKYTTTLDVRKEFLDACQFDCKIVL